MFTDDPRFEAAERDEWLPPPERPLPGGVERDRARSSRGDPHPSPSRPGHPLLVKVSYHPRWRAEGADGPYLVSPALMMVVPRQRRRCASRTRPGPGPIGSGGPLGPGALALGLALAGRRRSRSGRPDEAGACMPEGRRVAPRRWRAARALRALPLMALAALAALRPPRRPRDVELPWLDERASRAYRRGALGGRGRVRAPRARAAPSDDAPRRAGSCLRGEALLRARSSPRLAAEAFGQVVDAGSGPYGPQALFSGAARTRGGGRRGGRRRVWRARPARRLPGDALGRAPRQAPCAEIRRGAVPSQRPALLHLAHDRGRRPPPGSSASVIGRPTTR